MNQPITNREIDGIRAADISRGNKNSRHTAACRQHHAAQPDWSPARAMHLQNICHIIPAGQQGFRTPRAIACMQGA